MGCKKLTLYPEETIVIWHVRTLGEHNKSV